MGRPAIVNRGEVFAMLREGMTQTAIAARFRVTSGAINHHVTKARKAGTLPPDIDRPNTPAGTQGAPLEDALDYDHDPQVKAARKHDLEIWLREAAMR